jgi:hypothetical protein
LVLVAHYDEIAVLRRRGDVSVPLGRKSADDVRIGIGAVAQEDGMPRVGYVE